MATYISSNNNRFYAAVEAAFGQAPQITPANRLPAVHLAAHQQLANSPRQDKTGTRTFLGASSLLRRATAFSLTSYLTMWDGVSTPGYGPLLQSAMGGAPVVGNTLTFGNSADSLHLTTTAPHGLSVGSAVSQGNELRFVASVLDSNTIVLNAPFPVTPANGTVSSPSLNYGLGEMLPSVSLFDYWDPSTAVQRVVTGATVNELDISLNGNFHELSFSGLACDLLDSQTFVSGSGGLQSFPTEPGLDSFDYSIVAGHLGEAWLGVSSQQIFTLTGALIQIKNNLVPRNAEFGATYPASIAAGPRDVHVTFSLFASDASSALGLYAAAKQRTPISAMFQLGQQSGRMMGVYIPSLMLELPLYDDREPRLIWEFKGNTAQGTNNNEIFLALA